MGRVFGLGSRRRTARSMSAGRPHEVIGNDGPRWMTVTCCQQVQNPAYKPTRSLLLLGCSDGWLHESQPQSTRRHRLDCLSRIRDVLSISGRAALASLTHSHPHRRIPRRASCLDWLPCLQAQSHEMLSPPAQLRLDERSPLRPPPGPRSPRQWASDREPSQGKPGPMQANLPAGQPSWRGARRAPVALRRVRRRSRV